MSETQHLNYAGYRSAQPSLRVIPPRDPMAQAGLRDEKGYTQVAVAEPMTKARPASGPCLLGIAALNPAYPATGRIRVR